MTLSRILISLLSGIAVILLADISLADDNAERKAYVIELGHRLPEDVLPVVTPLLAEGDNATAFDNELILTTSPSRYSTILQIVEKLDTPLHNLMISVRNNNAGSGTRQSGSLGGGITHERIRIDTGQPVGSQGLTVESHGLSYSTSTTTRSTTSETGQQVRAVEGHPAFIATGESMPVATQDAYGNITYTDVAANKGFYVTARLAGERVILDISFSNDTFDKSSDQPGARETEHLVTSTSGAVGEWISLGNLESANNDSEHSLVKKVTDMSTSLGNIAIRVTPID
jgi:hypothetical protein